MKVVVLIFSLFALAAANPIFEFCFSEIQTAPDSFERVELHDFSGYLPLPLDLYGWQLVTSAGVCTVQTHVLLDDSTYAVLDRTNLGPAFTLGDEHDSLVLRDGYGEYVTETGYPDAMMNRCLAPPAGMSTSLYHIWTFGPSGWEETASWYIDATPTFGSANDDTAGGIRGRVTDDRGLPVAGAWVNATGPTGRLAWCGTDTAGRYTFHPTGLGVYEVGAHQTGYYSGIYPDSVNVGTNEWADSVNIVIVRTGVAETRATFVAPGLTLRGRTLLLDVPGRITIVNLAGRPVLRSTARTIDLAALPSGVYFVRLETVAGVVRRKVVLF